MIVARTILPTVTIDWPAQPAWPNRQKHWRPTANARDLQKNAAFYLAKEARWIAPAVLHRVHLTLTFCAPTARRFDLDNALAACKGAIDGLSACLGVDDSLFSYTLQRGEKTPGGAVMIDAEVK